MNYKLDNLYYIGVLHNVPTLYNIMYTYHRIIIIHYIKVTRTLGHPLTIFVIYTSLYVCRYLMKIIMSNGQWSIYIYIQVR